MNLAEKYSLVGMGKGENNEFGGLQYSKLRKYVLLTVKVSECQLYNSEKGEKRP